MSTVGATAHFSTHHTAQSVIPSLHRSKAAAAPACFGTRRQVVRVSHTCTDMLFGIAMIPSAAVIASCIPSCLRQQLPTVSTSVWTTSVCVHRPEPSFICVLLLSQAAASSAESHTQVIAKDDTFVHVLLMHFYAAVLQSVAFCAAAEYPPYPLLHCRPLEASNCQS